MVALSDTDIANRALVLLGQDPVTTLTDNTRAARVMNLLYVPTRDAMLRNGVWKFAKTSTALATSASVPAVDYSYYYQLPADYLRWVDSSFTDWKLHGKLVATNDGSPVYLEYIRKVTDPNQFDPIFVTALAAQLAVDACFALNADAAAYNRAKMARDEALSDARFTGSLEEPVVSTYSSSFMEARYVTTDNVPYRAIQDPTV